MARAAEAAAERGRSWWAWAGRVWQGGLGEPHGSRVPAPGQNVLWAGIRSMELEALILSQTN